MIYVGYEFLIWSADHWRKVGTREVPILNLGLFQSDWQSCFIYTDYGSRSGSLQRVPTGVESRRSWKRRFIFNNQTPNWCHRIFACLSELSVNDENALCAAGGRGREVGAYRSQERCGFWCPRRTRGAGVCASGIPCGLRGCKNRPAPFPGRMSYKTTKPGSSFVASPSRRDAGFTYDLTTGRISHYIL